MSQGSKHRLGSFLHTEVVANWLPRIRKHLLVRHVPRKAWESQECPTRHKDEKKQMERERRHQDKGYKKQPVLDCVHCSQGHREHWALKLALVTCKETTSSGCGQRGNMGNEWAPPQVSTHGIIVERLLCARCWSTNLGFCPQMLRLVSLPLFTQSSGINRDVENVWPIPHWRWEAENKAKHSLGNVGKVYWFQGKKGEEGKEAEEEWVAEKRSCSFVF